MTHEEAVIRACKAVKGPYVGYQTGHEFLAAYLEARGAVLCAAEPEAWECDGEGTGWAETNVITRDQELAEWRQKMHSWVIRPLHVALEAEGGKDGHCS